MREKARENDRERKREVKRETKIGRERGQKTKEQIVRLKYQPLYMCRLPLVGSDACAHHSIIIIFHKTDPRASITMFYSCFPVLGS